MLTEKQTTEIEIAVSSKRNNRWMILLLSFISSFGIYYCLYLPSALETNFTHKDSDYQLSKAQYNLFFSILYVSSLFVASIAGYLSDKMGIAKTRTIFLLISCVGQCVIFIGSCLANKDHVLSIMVIGRVIYGMGCESYQVANSALIADYFLGAESFLSMGLKLAFGRLTMCFTYKFGVSIFTYLGKSIPIAMLSGAVSMLVAVLVAAIVWIIDNKNQVKQKLEKHIESEKSESMLPNTSASNLSHNSVFWIMVLVTGINYCVTQGWLGMSNNYVLIKYKITEQEANEWVMIVPLIPMFLTPIVGYVIDMKPMRSEALLLSSVLLTTAHLVFTGNQYGYIAVILLGVGYAIFPAICWGAVALLVERENIGKAIGIMTAFLSLFLVVVPVGLGKLQDICVYQYGMSTQDERIYESTELVWLALSVVSFICTLCLWFVDNKNGNKLQAMTNKTSTN
eukprot:358466_1